METNSRLHRLPSRSAKFGLKYGPAFTNTAKHSKVKFYNEDFTKSSYKLTEVDLESTMKALKLGYSDDITTNNN